MFMTIFVVWVLTGSNPLILSTFNFDVFSLTNVFTLLKTHFVSSVHGCVCSLCETQHGPALSVLLMLC